MPRSSKHLRRTTSGVEGNDLGTTIKYLRGAAGVGLGTTIKYLRRATSAAAGNGLGTSTYYLRGAAGIGQGTTIKYLRRTTSGAAGYGLSITMNTASKLGPHTQTDRGTCPGVGL